MGTTACEWGICLSGRLLVRCSWGFSGYGGFSWSWGDDWFVGWDGEGWIRDEMCEMKNVEGHFVCFPVSIAEQRSSDYQKHVSYTAQCRIANYLKSDGIHMRSQVMDCVGISPTMTATNGFPAIKTSHSRKSNRHVPCPLILTFTMPY